MGSTKDNEGFGNIIGVNGQRYSTLALAYTDIDNLTNGIGIGLCGPVVDCNKLSIKDRIINLPDLNQVIIEMDRIGDYDLISDSGEVELSDKESVLIFDAMKAVISLIETLNEG